MYYLFGYLKKYNKFRILIDPPYRNNSFFEQTSTGMDPKWKEFYPDAEELIPQDLLKPLGKAACLSVLFMLILLRK
jgi:hypothetical protein